MGDPNPNHFLVHSALVLPPLVVQRSSSEAGEILYRKNPEVRVSRNQRNHRYRSANLRLVGQNVGFHRSSSSWCSSCFRTLFGVTFSDKVVWNKKKRHTHTHTLDPVFSTTWAFRLNPWHPEKNQSPQKTRTDAETTDQPLPWFVGASYLVWFQYHWYGFIGFADCLLGLSGGHCLWRRCLGTGNGSDMRNPPSGERWSECIRQGLTQIRVE